MTRVSILTVPGPRLERTVSSLARQTHAEVEHLVVSSLAEGFRDASGPYVVVLAAGSTITRGFLADAAALLDADPTVGLVAPGRPTPNGRPTFDLGAHLIRDALPPATMFRREQVTLDESLGGLMLWDAGLGILGRGLGVRLLERHTQGHAPRPPQADKDALATIMTRHLDLYRDAADEFWAAIMAQRTRLMDLKARYGRVEDALHGLADAVRRRP